MTESTKVHAGLIPLLVIATAQLMLVLDDSIVNIALPSIQTELGVHPVHLPWVVNAYILAFGALLLLGGRIGDLWAASAPCRSASRSSSSPRSSADSDRARRCSSPRVPSKASARRWRPSTPRPSSQRHSTAERCATPHCRSTAQCPGSGSSSALFSAGC